jgi:hypothetical protein
LSHYSGSRAIAGFSPEDSTTLNYSFNHARSGSNSCSVSTALLAHFDLAAPSGAILTHDDFHRISRAAGPGLTSCGNRPVRRATSKYLIHERLTYILGFLVARRRRLRFFLLCNVVQRLTTGPVAAHRVGQVLRVGIQVRVSRLDVRMAEQAETWCSGQPASSFRLPASCLRSWKVRPVTPAALQHLSHAFFGCPSPILRSLCDHGPLFTDEPWPMNPAVR